MPQDERSCFIIMPITTPESLVDNYRDGADHFKHVLECLFIPGVEQAGYKAIPPVAKGADLIHAKIIENLETADLVLCDMSCLNPNVFFEFGIRTSLNKPVCVIKDEQTKKVPFDTGIINHQEYTSSLDPWLLGEEIKRIAEHIRASFDRSHGENTLWKYFGLRSEAKRFEGEPGDDSKLDYLTLQIDSLNEKLGNMGQPVASDHIASIDVEDRAESALRFVNAFLPQGVFLVDKSILGPDYVTCKYIGLLPKPIHDQLQMKVMARYGVRLEMHPGVQFKKPDA